MDTCRACGEQLHTRLVEAPGFGGNPRTQRLVCDSSGEHHAMRCPDNPFSQHSRRLALAHARAIQREMAAL